MNRSSDGGKGSRPRPYSVDKDTFVNNWDKIFSKKNEKAPTEPNTVTKPGESGEVVVSGLQPDTHR
jgi:hypothetical protein